MLRSSCARSILAALTIIALPTNAAAQADPASIEGIEWHLASYDSGGGPVSVPWTIDATLLLEAGTASGSTGCNTFVGTYTLAAGGLSFDEPIAATEMACVGDADVVEQGYMSILPATATWATPADGVLQLDDAAGVTSLVFEQAVSSLTASDIAGMEARFEALQDHIDQLEDRLRNIRIGTLRDRISELESTVASLQRQVQELRSSGSGASSGGFNERNGCCWKAYRVRSRGPARHGEARIPLERSPPSSASPLRPSYATWRTTSCPALLRPACSSGA